MVTCSFLRADFVELVGDLFWLNWSKYTKGATFFYGVQCNERGGDTDFPWYAFINTRWHESLKVLVYDDNIVSLSVRLFLIYFAMFQRTLSAQPVVVWVAECGNLKAWSTGSKRHVICWSLRIKRKYHPVTNSTTFAWCYFKAEHVV